ncbi:Eukaryotic translation initiation factor 4 gamma [Apiospora sp. TS-2023a]
MTSTGNQQAPVPAPTNATTSAPSYASAAGAAKKTPLVAQGTAQQQPVVAGGSAPQQHAKSNSVSPVNGRPNSTIMPAVPKVTGPAVAHGSLNGESHSRKPSVTMTAPNGPSNPNGKNMPQFGFPASPAVPHTAPAQAGASAPIPIPGRDPRVTSPQHSPSPIPQPSASGGRPPANSTATVNFGSFDGRGETHGRRPSASHSAAGQNAHARNESSQSMASDPSNQGGPPDAVASNKEVVDEMGYPPNNQHYRGQPPHGRGGMNPNFQNRPASFAGTPPQTHASPNIRHSTPNGGMQPPMGSPYGYYGPPVMGPGMQQVHIPSQSLFDHTSFKPGKQRNNQRGGRDGEKYSHTSNQRNRSGSVHDNMSQERNGKSKHKKNKRVDNRFAPNDMMWDRSRGQFPTERGERIDMQQPFPPEHTPMMPIPVPTSHYPHRLNRGEKLDLSPESGNFEHLLTECNKTQYPQYPPFDPMRQGNMPPAGPPYGAPGQYNPGAAPMTRSSSQVSEHRPASSTGQPQMQGTPQPIPAQAKQPAVVSSPQFARPPKKSAAIVIKNANGEAVDLSTFKAPASPAPSIQQSKTPPVVASTPTPPPKSVTPAAHTRSDSATTTKTSAEVQNEFKEKIARQMAKDQSDAKATEDAKAAEEAKAAKDKSDAEEKVKQEEEKKAAEQKAQEEAKAKEEADAKAKSDAEAAAKAKEAEEKEKAPAAETEEEEMERMIREMEEEDARREAANAEYEKKKAAEREAKKISDEANKKVIAAENDRKMKEAEAEAERLEEEKERKRKEAENSGKTVSMADALAGKMQDLSVADKEESTGKPSHLTISDKPTAVAGGKPSPGERKGVKPPPLNLNTKGSVEPPQPSAALQSLKTAKLLNPAQLLALNYPAGINGLNSPNPALNSAVSKKGTNFKYDPNFLLQFKTVFTETPSMEFHQQVKTLIGDNDGRSGSGSARTPAAGRQNSRNSSGFPGMGNFASATGPRTLPPGTTSEDRMRMSAGQMARPSMGGAAIPSMGGFGRGGFPGSNSITGSRSTRGASKRDPYQGKNDAQSAKNMPLTAGMKLEPIQVTQNGWKPTSIGQKQAVAAPTNGPMDPAMVQRKVKSALNKMTPENFDRVSGSILEIAGQSKDETDGRTLRQVIQLTFEKATDEAHWASMYAKFCKRMLESMSAEIRDENIMDKNGQVVSGGALFRKYLLNRCQEEFERGWKTQLPQAKDGADKKAQEAVMLSDEYYIAAAAKRRGLGLVQFIGELYKLAMLTERIMHECVRKLVDYSGVPDEAEVESLSKLLKTIGGNLDASEKGRLMMDAYFQRIQSMADMPELNSRLKFMLMDVIDLRRQGWHSKEQNKGPKTLDEVRAEAEAAAAQKAAENARTSHRGGPGQRSQMGRGDARQFSGGYQAQQNQNTVGMDDLRRLKGAAGRTASGNVTLGPTSMFSSRSNSGRRMPGSALSRGNEDSAASSRTGTPPTREASNNAYSLLANLGEDHPASPPSTAASPALAKATPDTGASAKE